MFAVIMLRGLVNMNVNIKKTLKMLRLNRVNHCVIVPEKNNYKGMLKRAENYITYGEINKEILEQLVKKRGRLIGDKRLDDKEAKEIVASILKNNSLKNLKIKPVFRLSPPSKGLKSKKQMFPRGDLGYRGDKINDLLKRMI